MDTVTLPEVEGHSLGCRPQMRHDGRAVALHTHNGRECSADFPELKNIAGALGKRRATLDGELVCLRDDGRPDFAWLRRRLVGLFPNCPPALLQAFDGLSRDSPIAADLDWGCQRCDALMRWSVSLP